MSLKERLTKFATTPGGVIPASPGFMPDDARKVLALIAALENYRDWASEDEVHPCHDAAGGLWIDGTFSTVQELQAAADDALDAMEAE